MAIIENIIQEHSDEISALFNGNFKHQNEILIELIDQQDRIEAHLDGLLLDPVLGWENAQEALRFGDVGELYVASLVAIASKNQDYLKEVGKIAIDSPEMAPGFLHALLWYPIQTIQPIINSLIKTKSPVAQSLGVAALSSHGVDPGPAFEPLLTSDEKIVIQRAAQAAGEVGRVDLLSSLNRLLDHENPEVRFTVAKAATMLGSQTAAKALIDLVKQEEYRHEAMRYVIPLMSTNNAQFWLNELAKDLAYTRSVIYGTGVLGDPQNIPGLIRAMHHKEYARIAGNAFSLMTGVDVDEMNLTPDSSEETQPANAEPTEAATEDYDNDDPDRDEIFPWPDPEKITAWWQSNHTRFIVGQRYLMGLPTDDKNLITVLYEGNQQQRNAAALQLKLRRPEQPLFNTRVRVSTQIAILNALSAELQAKPHSPDYMPNGDLVNVESE